MQEKWKNLDKSVTDLLNEGKTLDQISNNLNLDKEELRLFLHRYRKFKVRKKDNIVIKLLTELIGHPEYFQPTQKFYKDTGIRQRRWWQIYKGEKVITEREYLSFCNHLKVDTKMAMNVRQLDLFDNVL